MVIAKLMGGMGNQMFQYAAARAVAYKYNTTLKLDLNYLLESAERKNVIKRNYELKVFNIIENIADSSDLDKVRFVKPGFINKIFNTNYTYYKEPHFHFDAAFDSLKNVYLDGFWQSERYFKSIAQTIANDFTFKHSSNKEVEGLLNEISNSQSVSIHIRRGDYVSNAFTNSYHGTCDISYYIQALEYLSSRVMDIRLYVFSDDIRWAKENLKVTFPIHFVTQNDGEKNYEDMRLMSTCKHNIIANSTFSWWSAWLNKNPQKLVIAPVKWFKNSDSNPKDLIPSSWIKI